MLSVIIFTFLYSSVSRKIYAFSNFPSRAPANENISLTRDVVYFKGTIYGNLHIGDIFALLIIFVMILKMSLESTFSIFPSGTFAVLLYAITSALGLINASDLTT